MKKQLIFAALALAMAGITAMAQEYATLDKATLADKIKGGWAAKTIGCTYGGPVEFIHNGTMIQDYTPILWNKDRVKYYFDTFPGLYDDLYMNIVLENAIEAKGLKATAADFAKSFVDAGFPLWHANQQARYNLTHGITPELAGYWENNPHADDIDFQIEADFIGLISPGMPVAAADIADRAGHIFNYGDGWYGGVYVAALFAEAFVNDDINTMVDRALRMIPAQSDFYKCIDAVVRCHKANPSDWKEAWYVCQRDWSEEVGCPDGVFNAFDIDAKINSAYVTIGLLYGDGDFFKTIDIATRCGQDADCNPATAGGILATMTGYSAIPRKWTESLDEIRHIPFAYTDISLDKLDKMTLRHAIDNVVSNGGSISGDKVRIKIQKPVAVRYEKSFAGHYPKEKISVNQALSADVPLVVDFDGIGIVQKGYVKCPDTAYEAEVEISVDGLPVETAKLPVYTDSSIDNRRVDLFYRYKLANGKHKVSFKWLNPRQDASVTASETLVYSDKPYTVKY